MLAEDENPVCPDCDEPFVSLGSHWARSADCDYPTLAPDDDAVLDGLMLVGGSLRDRAADTNPYLSIVHHDREVLDWIADQLDVLVASISEFDKSHSVAYLGDAPTRTLWDLRTRSLPALEAYHAWYSDGSRTVPEDIESRPLLIKTACLLAARPMTDRPGIYLSLQRTRPPRAVVERVFGNYSPRLVERDDGGYVVRLLDADALREDLAPWPACAPI